MNLQWYQKSIQQTLSDSLSSLEGLTEDEAKKRLDKNGPNLIIENKSSGIFKIFIKQFLDFLIIVLIIAAVISYFIGDSSDAMTIIVIVVMNALLGFYQEYKALKTMDSLKKLVNPKSFVKREGKIIEVLTSDIVFGDIISIEPGIIIPADARLIEAYQLQIDESMLTGESLSIFKNSNELYDDTLSLGDQVNMLFKGSLALAGRGNALVTNTGMATELGLIARLISKESEQKTPLQIKMNEFSKKITYIIFAICTLLLAIGLLKKEPPYLALMTAISLAVAAIPEALPALLTITLALGSKRMALKNALVRKLSAVETLGRVSIICTDKTGTLTLNKMRVNSFYYDSHFQKDLSTESSNGKKILQILAQNHDAYQNEKGIIIGEPTEAALLEYALKKKFSRILEDKLNPRIAEISFSSERKMMSTIHKLKDQDSIIIWTKGAAEAILPLCKNVNESDYVNCKKMALTGERVLAMAYKILPQNSPFNVESFKNSEIESNLEFLGCVGLIDPARPGVKESIEECKSAGIKILMISGDHPNTALAIAHELAIVSKLNSDFLLTGSELAGMSDTDLEKIIATKFIFARVNPDQKIRLVKALQKQGEIVAMTGDGINDSPALKAADIGIAMGKMGTEVAKEASALILLDDNFSSIAAAVREGRRIYDNIRKFINYSLAGNSGEIWTIALASFLSLPAPLLPIQILWINLVTDGLPGLALSIEVEEQNIMKRPPRDPKEKILARSLGIHVLWVGLLMAFITLSIMSFNYYRGSTHWQTMAFTLLSFLKLGHLLVIRSETQSLFKISLKTNIPLYLAVGGTLILQVITIYHPFFNTLLKTTPLTLFELSQCFGSVLILISAVEIEKIIKKINS